MDVPPKDEECLLGKLPTASEEEQKEYQTTCTKRKVEDDDDGAESSASRAAVGDCGSGGAAPAERKFVEMPMSLLSWILSQERPTGPLNFPLLNPEENVEDRKLIEEINSHNQEREAMDDLFYEFQAWVRQQYNNNGRVMCPETFLRGPVPGSHYRQ